MHAVFFGSLIHHLRETLLAKVLAPWRVARFLEQDPRPALARGAPLMHQLK